jgi:putative ABC transport system permease protein
MFRNNFTIAWRRLLNDRQFALLNILGLSTGLTCAILIFIWVRDERSVDRYNAGDSRLYQVLLNSPAGDGNDIATADYTPGLLAATLSSGFPEVDKAVPVVPNPWHDKKYVLSTGEKMITTSGVFIGGNFFDIFSVPLLAGNKRAVFNGKNDVVISTDLAQSLFNTTQDLVGKTLQWDHKEQYRIAGVFRKPPANATMQFDLAFNYDLFLDKNPKLLDWRNNDPSTFVLLKKDARIDDFNKKMAGLIKAHNEKGKSTLFAQRYSDRYLHGVYANGRPSGGRIQYVRLFSLIALFILVIACINFMNLSTARAAGRIKEAGIKKVIGANRASLVRQYLLESMLLTTLSVLLAIGLAALALPAFDRITGKQLHLSFDTPFTGTLVAITLVTGLLAGSYPAFYCSGFKPAVSLAGRLPSNIGERAIRKGLVVFQFALSTVFIVGVLVVSSQMDLIQSGQLGYNRNNLLYFRPAFDTSLPDFVQELRNTPGVLGAANFGQNITNRDGGTYDISWPGKDPNSTIVFTDLAIGYDFIETAGIRLVAGRPFSPQYGNDKSALVFNQTAVGIMGIKDPIGKTVRLWGEDHVIIGVAEDFHFQSLHEAIKPCFFQLNTTAWASNIMVRVAPGSEQSTIRRLDALYKAKSNGLPFEYTFLDEDYQRLYAAEVRVNALSRYFAALAVIISALGIVGLAAFTAQKRQREIGIRKVIGAGADNILFLLTKDFLRLTVIALLIALPVAAWVMNDWLNGFAYHVKLTPVLFVWASGVTIGITFVSIAWQCWRAASTNPVKALRSV